MDPLHVGRNCPDGDEIQSRARQAEDEEKTHEAETIDQPPNEEQVSELARSKSQRSGQLQLPKSDIEAQACQVEEEEQLHEAQLIDRPPDGAQDIRMPKVYRPYDLPILLILAPASILGVLGRLGLVALVTFEGSSVFALGYVNALGCLIMGFGLSMKGPLGEYYGPFYTALTTGFCGSLTTFSGWQFDIFNSWINAGNVHRNGLSDFINGVGISTVTLSLSLGSVSFGYTIGLVVLPYLKFPRFPPRWQRHTASAVCALVYGATIVTYFLLSASFRSEATAAVLFSYPGTLTRYILSIGLNPRFKALPTGTLAANTVGTALLAGFHVLQNLNAPISPYACSVLQGLIDGYCGCLTTVSTFAAEACRYVVVSWVLGQAMMLLILGPSYWTGHASERITCRFQ
ncbi:hypothetical protein FA13DRAFT_1753220 [Coprinellus micaceus]|uniref:CRCB-domain-containing protein n=1 Tax=Coprinellus micaceus TaxID=71717 RepID=A0A4Y7TQ44_COPMI|nr:hypothetical protein FA13DRAFT_1753220 [Coprinellus micaceus]